MIADRYTNASKNTNVDERNLLLKNITNRICSQAIKNSDIKFFSLFKERVECENIFIIF